MATVTISPKPILHLPQVSTDQISQEEIAEFIGAQKTLEKLAQVVQNAEASLLARLGEDGDAALAPLLDTKSPDARLWLCRCRNVLPARI